MPILWTNPSCSISETICKSIITKRSYSNSWKMTKCNYSMIILQQTTSVCIDDLPSPPRHVRFSFSKIIIKDNTIHLLHNNIWKLCIAKKIFNNVYKITHLFTHTWKYTIYTYAPRHSHHISDIHYTCKKGSNNSIRLFIVVERVNHTWFLCYDCE